MKFVQLVLVFLIPLSVATRAHAQFTEQAPEQNQAPAQPSQPVPPAPTGQPPGYGAQPIGPPLPMPEEPPVRNLITVNPLSLIFGGLSLEYEHAFGDRVSLAVGPDLLLFDSAVRAYGVSAALRLFVTGTAPEGLWIGPNTSVVAASAEGLTGFGYEIGAQLGFTWIWGAFALSVGGGVRYQDITVRDGGSVVAGSSGVLPSLRLALGFGF